MSIHLHILGTIHNCKEITDLYSRLYPENEMPPIENKGQWDSFFYLTLSGISADIYFSFFSLYKPG